MDALTAAIRKELRGKLRKSPEDQTWLSPFLRRSEYLFWFCNRLGKSADLSVFLTEIKSDCVHSAAAMTIGARKSVYLHSRCILENLVRHLYFSYRPVEFARSCRPGNQFRVAGARWKEQVQIAFDSPHFWLADLPNSSESEGNGVMPSEEAAVGISGLTGALKRLYTTASEVIHSSNFAEQEGATSFASLSISGEERERLHLFWSEVYAVCVMTLALFHVGVFQRLHQPVRKYLLANLPKPNRRWLIAAFNRLPFDWIRSERDSAIRQHISQATSLPFVHGNAVMIGPARSPGGSIHRSGGTDVSEV